MADDTPERCRALTGSGERCSRPAEDDGFCFQHDESDETVDDGTAGAAGAEDAPTLDAEDAPAADGGEATTAEDGETGGSRGGEEGDSSGTEADREGAGDATDVVRIRDAVASMTGRLIGRELDGVVEVTGLDDHWEVVVEVVERPAVPDTQDILGRYQITLEDPDTVTGFRRIDTYRRGGSSRGDPGG